MRNVFIGILVVAALFALVWVGAYNDWQLSKVFAPRREAVRRATFEESKAYVQGTIQDLQRMQFEYVQAAPEHKPALRSVILHRVADFPEDKLPADLRLFVDGLKREIR